MNRTFYIRTRSGKEFRGELIERGDEESFSEDLGNMSDEELGASTVPEALIYGARIWAHEYDYAIYRAEREGKIRQEDDPRREVKDQITKEDLDFSTNEESEEG